jgi:arginyl-tRNA synthetase
MDNISIILGNIIKDGYYDTEYGKYLIDLKDTFWEVSYLGKYGKDYSFNGLIILTKMLNKKNINVLPNDLYEKMLSFMKLGELADINFNHNSINIKLKDVFIMEKINSVHNLIHQTNDKKKILVDFSSPNVAKDMHVGHLRSTIIGENICRFYEEVGHDVMRINHIGDFGLPFGMIIQYIYEEYPNFMNTKDDMTISDLQSCYALSKARFDENKEFQLKAYQRVVELQNGDLKVVDIWNTVKEISRKSYQDIYNRLNISLIEVGESFYQNMIPSVVQELKEKQLLEEDNGRIIIKVNGSKLPLTIVKSDGGYTYDTTDLAAIRYRLVDQNVDKIYYVVGTSQSQHFKLIFEVAKMAGWLKPHQELCHVGFGLILGEDGKPFRSRMGDTVKLVNLLDEGLVKAMDVIKNRDVTTFNNKEINKIVKSVGYSAIKYYDLSTSRLKDYKFSYDNMLSLKGNTAVYLLYAYVRISAIIRKASDHINIEDIYNYKIDVINDYERELSIYILHFPEIIKRVGNDFCFHTMCDYLYKLSNVFHNFFKNCRCIFYEDDKKTIKEINYSRLQLSFLTKKIINKCFYLLNIEPLERM